MLYKKCVVCGNKFSNERKNLKGIKVPYKTICPKQFEKMKSCSNYCSVKLKKANAIKLKNKYVKYTYHTLIKTAKGNIKIDSDDINIVNKYVWHITKLGYALTYINRKTLFIHRLIMKLGNVNKKLNNLCDHINGDPLDNRKSNLRICGSTENSYNKKVQTNNKLGVKGVIKLEYKNTGWVKYEARIRANGKIYILGYFDTIEEAKNTYNKKAKELHKEFARY